MGEYPDTPEGNLNKNIKAVIAEYERLKINERMVRGRRQKVKSGNIVVHGRPPYGFRLEEVDGKSKLVICEAEAEIIRLIYRLYLYGEGKKGPLSTRMIARRLTEMGIPIPALSRRASTKWSRTTVGRILSSKTYVGIWQYGKFGSLQGHRFRNPQEHLISVEIPAIIDKESWDITQEKRKINIENAKRNLKYSYLLNRRLTCGVCGSKMAASGTEDEYKNHLYYRCNIARGYADYERKCDNVRYYKSEQVDAVVWEWLRAFINDPQAIEQGIADYEKHREQELEPFRNRLEVVNDLITNHQEQLKKLLDLYLTGDFPKEMLFESRKRLEDTLQALETEKLKLIEALSVKAYTHEQLEKIKEFTLEIAAGLEEADEDFEIRKHIVEMLDVRATLKIEKEEKIAYVTCVFKEDPDPVVIAAPTTYRLMRPGNRNPAFVHR